MFDKKQFEENRHKMSEAVCYRKLIMAIVRQAAKDGAAWFFETETGKGYCAIVGINPVKLMGERV